MNEHPVLWKLSDDDRMDQDMDFGLSDPAVIQNHGGKVVAVWNKEVWGVGDTYADALAAALDRVKNNPSLDNPTREAFVFVPVPRPMPADFSYPTY